MAPRKRLQGSPAELYRYICSATIALVGSLYLFAILGVLVVENGKPARVAMLETVGIDYLGPRWIDAEESPQAPMFHAIRPSPPSVDTTFSPTRVSRLKLGPIRFEPMSSIPIGFTDTISALHPKLGGMEAPEGTLLAKVTELERIQPTYPMDAAAQNISGFVRIEFVVQADGRVREAAVMDAQPKGVFDAAAVAAVLKWRFKPRIREGQPVEWRASQKIHFEPSF